ncbi:HK97 gp10 family phage protein [Gulosibacter hominis]|uniref:HK97 gp10 family phage protein n=1 Tax=Gulosibacter hominis TaxID=2770504 RepID=UPI00191A3E06|nr:HK97 gp10 family phage protein [Gulosibacter hominis]
MAVYVVGARELRRQLKAAGDDLGDLKAVHRQGAEIVAAAASRRAPRVSGKLAGSIRTGVTQKTGIVRAGSKRRVPYAAVIHWGWHKRGIRPSLFAAKAAKETEPEWVAAYEKRMNEIIDQIKGKQGDPQ